MKLPQNKILRYFLFVVVVGLAVGIMNSTIIITTHMAGSGEIKILFPSIHEITGGFSFALLLPIMIFLFKKYPITKKNFMIRIPFYLLAAAPLGIVHTFLMYGSRQLIYNFAGWGSYDYGIMSYRIVMEYIKMLPGFSVTYVIVYYIQTLKEKEKERIARVTLEEQLTQAKLDALKSQLNPHFLFNTLNMISSTMYDDVNAADRMIANLSELLRESLKSSSEAIHKLSAEIKLLNLYNEIMLERFKDKLQIDVNFEKDVYNVFVPTFLLQPFVENSIKHCMEMNSEIRIKIHGKTSEDKFNIFICDNGPGIKKHESEVLQSGIGLSNTIERLKNIYNDNFDFSWQNLDTGGLQIKILLPLNQNENE